MKKIKICGITEDREIEYLNQAEVDFAGFIQFYEKSRRNIGIGRAKELMRRLAPQIRPVAVTVGPTAGQLRQIEEAGFAMVQIHGNISDELLATIRIPVLKAFNIIDLSEFGRYDGKENVAGYVFDAQVPGSGKVFDWSLLADLPRTRKLSLLAGGLHAGNVAEALAVTGMDGADTSSGVENDNGVGKDPEKIRKFADAVRRTGTWK